MSIFGELDPPDKTDYKVLYAYQEGVVTCPHHDGNYNNTWEAVSLEAALCSWSLWKYSDNSIVYKLEVRQAAIGRVRHAKLVNCLNQGHEQLFRCLPLDIGHFCMQDGPVKVSHTNKIIKLRTPRIAATDGFLFELDLRFVLLRELQPE